MHLIVFYVDGFFSLGSYDSATLRVAKYQCGDVLRLILPVQISLKLWRLQRLVNDRASVAVGNDEIERDLFVVNVIMISLNREMIRLIVAHVFFSYKFFCFVCHLMTTRCFLMLRRTAIIQCFISTTTRI
ncbi:hypothetical protein NY2A_b121L [Paramecium bursaria Chlorella virus NY2A]|uniref:Uncharacterized protein b121L n=1 Tax=Paramecium bursaria Chlorella virus NY2A TaxID=46021 RepID=A7IVZ6_PBCVN|nr:hypothetical protein NY2A_b121L [Paramecium bursaria Chlorella virus NY2A]ABT14520.1 hypothetical protein NY2A_b121L [Paramecium bursaria Chlorella virus NY2A]